MKTRQTITETDRKTRLSTLWIFVLFNMVYADILGTLRPGYLESLDRISQELSGEAVLFFAVLMEFAISMVLLSRVLTYKANRWTHFIAVPITILWVVVPALMPSLGEDTPLSYLFFASVEVTTMLIILWSVWTWPKPANRHSSSY